MSFPSDSLRMWCANVEWLRRELEKTYPGQIRQDGFCQCGVGLAISKALPDQQAQLCSGLFWSVWIDQVLFTVSHPELYVAFRRLYSFPKLYSHPEPGCHASPAFLLKPPDNREGKEWQYERPNRGLLLEDKEDFWGEVGAWLKDVGQENTRQSAESEFRKDLHERFSAGFEFLFAE